MMTPRLIFLLVMLRIGFSSAVSSFSPCEESLQLCTCSPDLLVADCSRKGLGDPPSELPKELQELSLARNALGARVNGSQALKLDSLLKQLPNLISLDLSNNGLVAVSAIIHKELRILDLSGNNVSSVRALKLEGLVSLSELDLSGNRLLSLPYNSFPASIPLTKLNLRSNRIVSLEKGSLDSLTALTELILTKNRLSSFPKGIFKHLRNLEVLEVNRNKLIEVGGLSFDGLVKLRVLKMKRNRIEYLNDGAFFGLHTIEEIYLDQNKIPQVDKGWLYGQYTLKTLSLSNNEIDYITDDAWEFCRELTDLDLSSNKLQLLDRDSLRMLPQLRRLHLRDNIISHVQDDDTFAETPLLEVLDLAGNEISHSVEDMHAPFGGLSMLLKVSLARNQIKAVGDQAFLEVNNLREIDLRDNIISSVQENAFEHLVALERLMLDTGSLLCDCHLKWLPRWLNETGVIGSQGAKCAHPEVLKGKTVLHVAYEDFTCDDFPKPYILKQPATQIALKGANLTLTCRAASTSPEEMSFQWKHDSHDLGSLAECTDRDTSSEPCLRSTAHSYDGKGREVTSELQLRKASYDDAGRYQCVVSNRFGATYSDKANVTVYVFPTFLTTPEDITIEGGKTAELKCAAKGVPAPKVGWSKDSGSDFPAASERRIAVMPSAAVSDDQSATGNSFFIYTVKAKDMGVYTCTAENPAGKITWNITLSVLEAPRFVKPMERRKSTPEGETAVLECLAAGSPKPVLTWTKNGGRLNTTERHFFTADSQLLIIVKARAADAGLYECAMHNRLGAQRQSTQLTITTDDGLVGDVLDGNVVIIIVVIILACIFVTSCIWLIYICRARRLRRRRERLRRGSFSTNGTRAPSSHIAKAEFQKKDPAASSMLLGGTPGAGEFDIHEHVRRGLGRRDSSGDNSGTMRNPDTGVLTTDLSLSTANNTNEEFDLQGEMEERDSGTGDSKKSSEGPPELRLGSDHIDGLAHHDDEELDEEEALMSGAGEGLFEFELASQRDANDDMDEDYATQSLAESDSFDQQGGGEGLEGQWGSMDMDESTASESIRNNQSDLNRSNPERKESHEAVAAPFRTFHPRGRRQREISELIEQHTPGMRPSASSFAVFDQHGSNSGIKPSQKRGSAMELNGACYLQIDSSPAAPETRGAPSLEPSVYRGGVGSLPRHGLEMQLEMLEASLNSTAEERQAERRVEQELGARKSASRSSLFGASRKKKSGVVPGVKVRDPHQQNRKQEYAKKDRELFA